MASPKFNDNKRDIWGIIAANVHGYADGLGVTGLKETSWNDSPYDLIFKTAYNSAKAVNLTNPSMSQEPSFNDNEIDLLRKIAENTSILAGNAEDGVNSSITTASLVGKTATFTNGVLTHFA